MLCIRWDQTDIEYNDLWKPNKAINTVYYCQQMINYEHELIEKQLKWATRQEKIIFSVRQHGITQTEKEVWDAISAMITLFLLNGRTLQLAPFRLPLDFKAISHLKNYGDVEM